MFLGDCEGHLGLFLRMREQEPPATKSGSPLWGLKSSSFLPPRPPRLPQGQLSPHDQPLLTLFPRTLSAPAFSETHGKAIRETGLALSSTSSDRTEQRGHSQHWFDCFYDNSRNHWSPAKVQALHHVSLAQEQGCMMAILWIFSMLYVRKLMSQGKNNVARV